MRDIDLNNGGGGPAKAIGVIPPAYWPAGVGPISLDGLERLGVDDDNKLYWDGKKLQIEKRVKLNLFQNSLAVLATIGAVASGVHPFLVSWHLFGF